MSRRSKLTPEVQAQIVGMLRAGVYIETAAAKAKIGRQTLYDWLNKGKAQDEGPYRDFYEAVTVAQAEDEANTAVHLEGLVRRTITKPCPECSAAVKVPVPDRVALNAICWKLERKFPDRYGGKLKIEHRTQDRIHEIVDAVEPHMPPESYAHFLRALAAIMGEEGLAAAEAPEGGGEPTPVH